MHRRSLFWWRGRGSRGSYSKSPVSPAGSAGREMRMARHDAEPAARPGRRDGGVWAPAVDLRGVHKHFGSVQAVRGVALTIGSGEVMAFLGPNGAGKTSTIDMILGLSRPDAGAIETESDPASITRPGAQLVYDGDRLVSATRARWSPSAFWLRKPD